MRNDPSPQKKGWKNNVFSPAPSKLAAIVTSYALLAPAITLFPNLFADAQPQTKKAASQSSNSLQRIKNPPLGLPTVPIRQDNPPTKKKIDLGRKLFFDNRLSRDERLSCAHCHQPSEGFTQNNRATPHGISNQVGRRNAPTLLNIAYFDRLFHDGRETSLETQFITPATAPHEMANPSIGYFIQKIKWLNDYDGLFEEAFGKPPTVDTVGMALATYQRTLLAGNSPFDQWYYAGDAKALSAKEIEGFELFTGRANCASCHHIRKKSALFTDNAFHDIGYAFMRSKELQERRHKQRKDVGRKPDLGRFETTGDPKDRWRIRTPTLRNIALTGPYMHDGRLKSLNDVIDFYNKGGFPHQGQDIRIMKLGLTKNERSALLAFLKALTSLDILQMQQEAPSRKPQDANPQ